MNLEIRKAQSKDLEQVYDLLLQMIESEDISSKKVSNSLMKFRIKKKEFQKHAKEELLKEFNEENSIYLVAQIDNKIVGYIRGSLIEAKDAFFETYKYGYLNALVVDKNDNGKGIASKLNAILENWFKENKCKQVHLEVFSNNPANEAPHH